MADNPFNFAAPLSYIQTKLAAAVQSAQIGVPESAAAQSNAYVTMGAPRISHKATGLLEADLRYWIEIAYALDGNEAASESALAAILVAFINSIYADLSLGGTVRDGGMDFTAADDPAYARIAGQEMRVYPFAVTGKQRQIFTPI
jgi:hypothetical protein